MSGKPKTYNFSQKGSAIFMIAALLWLTISTPLVFANQQKFLKQNKTTGSQSPFSGNEEESSNPFSDTTEEKNSANTSLSEEYLHDCVVSECALSECLQFHKCGNTGIYHAFHGELLVPPPNKL